MEQFERIRRDHRDEELSIRELASRHRVHRRTVRAALADAVPPERKAAGAGRGRCRGRGRPTVRALVGGGSVRAAEAAAHRPAGVAAVVGREGGAGGGVHDPGVGGTSEDRDRRGPEPGGGAADPPAAADAEVDFGDFDRVDRRGTCCSCTCS